MGNRTPQQTVRAGRFEQRLGEVEMGLRRSFATDMATALMEYHKLAVLPLQERIAFLERVTGIAAARWLAGKLRRRPPPPAPAPEPDEPAEA
jgi:hypothetical protein